MSVDLQNIPIDQLRVFDGNPRRKLANVEKLAADIRDSAENAQAVHTGLLVPLIVAQMDESSGMLDVICGQRRLAALRQLEADQARCLVHTDITRDEALCMALSENCQREDLHPIELAESIQHMLDNGIHLGTVAEIVGLSESALRARLRLLALHSQIRDEYFDGRMPDGLTLGHFIELAKVFDPDQQLAEYNSLIERAERQDGAMPGVDAFRKQIVANCRKLSRMPWLEDAELGQKPCDTCNERSDAQLDLFGGAPAEDAVCLNRACWDAKQSELVRIKLEKEELPGVADPYVPDGMPPEYIPVHLADPKAAKVDAVLTAGPDKGKTVQVARAADKAQAPQQDTGNRKMSPKERNACDQAVAAFVVDAPLLDRPVLLAAYAAFKQALGSSQWKIINQRFGIEQGPDSTTSLPTDSDAAHELVWGMVATAACEPSGIRTECLPRLLALAKSMDHKGLAPIAAEHDVFFDSKGKYRANALDRAAKRHKDTPAAAAAEPPAQVEPKAATLKKAAKKAAPKKAAPKKAAPKKAAKKAAPKKAAKKAAEPEG